MINNEKKSVKIKLKCIKEKVKKILIKLAEGIIIRKLKEISLIIKAFIKALIDVFIVKQYDEIYVSLAPTKNADKDGTYCNAIKYAIENKEIKNIAITGNYGSGKSSVIQTFFNKLENIKYNPIYVSLAAFNKNDYMEKNNKQADGNEKLKEIKSKNEFYHTLEKSILQQLLYQASEKDVPLSRFKRISKHSKLLLNIATIGILCSIIILTCIIFPGIIDIIKNNYYTVRYSLTIFWTNIFIGILIVVAYVITYKILFFLSTKFNISKFKVKDAEVEINSKPESIFNKYLDEIIYFFQVTNHKVVIIEDLDRYEGDASFIFQKLRELNTLINSSNQVKYEVDFIYAIKDDFFKDYEERTKFFDYIIPIIPISSNGNSNEIMWKRLEKLKKNQKINFKFDKTFIDEVSILIEDKRLIDNIINEFIIYKNKMHNELMDDRQLFAIIMYKNIFPKNYSELQRNKGSIVHIFQDKKKIIKNLTNELQEEKAKLYEEKIMIQSEYLNNIKELKYVLLSSIYNYNNYSGYERCFELDREKITIKDFLDSIIDIERFKNSDVHFKIRSAGIDLKENEVFKEFGNKATFVKRWENIDKGKTLRLIEVQKKIEKFDVEIQNISKLSLKQIINKYNLSTIFDNSNLVEKVFITKGYITEDYKDYITLFVPGNLTKEDNEFVFAIKTGEKLPYDFKLEKIENILKKLDENDYETNAILNLDLLNYLIKENYYKEVLKIIEILDKQNDELQFVNAFIEKYDTSTKFIELLTENSNKIWKRIYSKIGNKEYVDRWIMNFLLNEKALKNVDENFKEYIREHNDIDRYVEDEQINIVINSLKTLKIKLANIQKINNEKFLEQIYLKELYELNSIMIKLILSLKNINQEEFASKNLTIILANTDLNNLKEYVLNEFEEYYNFCYTLNKSDEDEEEIIMEIIQNEDISMDIKKGIIVNEKFDCYNIENIDRKLIDIIITEDKLKTSYCNVLSLFVKDGELKEDIIKNISSHIQEYKEDKIDDYNCKFSKEIIEKFKMKYIFNNNVSIKDLEILIDTFNVSIKVLEECECKKLEYIIDKEIVEFNVDNFKYIKQEMENKLIKFIIINLEEFIENIEEYDITGYENDLLNCIEINKECKIEIAQHIEIEELENSTLINLICDNIISVNHNQINKRILNDENILCDNKIKMLRIILKNIDNKEQVTEYIHLLKNGYKYINTNKNACSIPYTESNLELLKILKEKGYISSYRKGKNNNNFIIYNKVNR